MINNSVKITFAGNPLTLLGNVTPAQQTLAAISPQKAVEVETINLFFISHPSPSSFLLICKKQLVLKVGFSMLHLDSVLKTYPK